VFRRTTVRTRRQLLQEMVRGALHQAKIVQKDIVFSEVSSHPSLADDDRIQVFIPPTREEYQEGLQEEEFSQEDYATYEDFVAIHLAEQSDTNPYWFDIIISPHQR